MRRFEFTEKQRQAIQYERYRHPDPNVQKRMEILALKMHGETHQRIAVLAGVSRSTVQRVLDLFWQGGLEKVRQFQWHIPTSDLAGHAETLAEEFRRRPPHTVAEACRRIEELTGIRRGREQVRLFLKDHLGLSWRKTAAIPIPPKQTLPEHAARQADFLKSGS